MKRLNLTDKGKTSITYDFQHLYWQITRLLSGIRLITSVLFRTGEILCAP